MDIIKINIGGVIAEMGKDEVSKALEAGELNVNAENLVVYSKDKFDEFKTNFANDEYKKGKTAGEEMLVKTLKEQTGIDVEGKKPDIFLNAFKSKVLEEAKIEPSKKIAELQSDLEKVQNNYKSLETEYAGFKTTIQQKEAQQKKDAIFTKLMPKEGLLVDSDIAIMAIRNKVGIDIDFDESGNAIIRKGDSVLKDEKTLSPIAPEDYIPSVIESLGLVQKQQGGGRGAGDDYGGRTATDYDKFVNEMEKNDISEGSLKFSQEMQKRIKEGTLKI